MSFFSKVREIAEGGKGVRQEAMKDLGIRENERAYKLERKRDIREKELKAYYAERENIQVRKAKERAQIGRFGQVANKIKQFAPTPRPRASAPARTVRTVYVGNAYGGSVKNRGHATGRNLRKHNMRKRAYAPAQRSVANPLENLSHALSGGSSGKPPQSSIYVNKSKRKDKSINEKLKGMI